MIEPRTIAYFSMEIGLQEEIPTYSGGLGMLAGDTLRSAADLQVPLVAVTLLHRQGYFFQRIDAEGWQGEEPVAWPVDDYLNERPERAVLQLEGREVHIRAWEYKVTGVRGHAIPVFLLDTDLPENDPRDRALTQHLYGGDSRYRLAQEMVLGMGGVRMLGALGFEQVERFHLNEGHAALLTLELLDQARRKAGREQIGPEDVAEVRRMCVFTTHTPVPAGHDRFPLELAGSVLGAHVLEALPGELCCEGELNMTYLALNLSHYVNGVARKHGEVSRHMFADYVIDSITNGVHAATWVAEPFQKLFDRYIPGWREDNFSLRYAMSLPDGEVWEAHMAAKRALIELVNRETNAGMDKDILTLGFARRAAAYKRADLIFQDPERLRALGARRGGLQLVFAGKAHPKDEKGKQLIQRVIQAGRSLGPQVRVAYLPNYDMTLGRLVTSGVDVWLNNPEPPLEASGTSGMKSALNGVPSLSILDGWWIEGCLEGITGWAFGGGPGERAGDAEALYEKLEQVVDPLFYDRRDAFIAIMRKAIALNGSFFNTQRMVLEYVLKAYL